MISRSGIVDLDYCRAQADRPFRSSLAAAWYYLGLPPGADFSPHPLFDPAIVGTRLKPGVNAVVGYLTQPELRDQVSPHPIFDLQRAATLAGTDGSADAGAWLAWVRSATARTPVPVAAAFDPITWGELHATFSQAAHDWRAAPSAVGTALPSRPASAGFTTIVVALSGAEDAMARRSLLDGSGPRQLVCLVNSRTQFDCLTVIARSRPSVVVQRSSGNLAKDWNTGAGVSVGERLVFVAPRTRLDALAIDRLTAALEGGQVAVAQPLNERLDMTIRSAGAYFPPDDLAPSPLLDGHPTSDAERLGTRPVPAALSGVVALRRELFFGLGGFDERLANDFAEVDLSLRATEAGAGQIVLVPDARATVPKKRTPDYPSDAAASLDLLRQIHPKPPAGSAEYLAAAGFEVSGHRSVPVGRKAHSASMPVPQLSRPRTGLDALPSLRWTIDTPVTAGWWAQIWGDWHFAASLARALRRLGQQVAVDTKQARERETRRFDDVLLTLRGLDRVEPADGRVNLIWVISHPDEVTAAEVGGYDRVFAASASWSADRSAAWGVLIEPLLQCTEAEFFHPARAASAPSQRALFVGNLRPDRTRPMVDAALAAGVGLDLYGTGWEESAAAGQVKARKVANEELGRLYAEAGVVLNDHWADMGRDGFISNRLFDAVACGARVLSDQVAGVDELFGGSVRFCATEAEAENLLRQPLDSGWPDLHTRLANAERVRREHSFDQRAQVLLAAAIAALGNR